MKTIDFIKYAIVVILFALLVSGLHWILAEVLGWYSAADIVAIVMITAFLTKWWWFGRFISLFKKKK